ncbi:MAG: hypothetical protein HYR49_10735 [Gammaproteobacteria bacterium]|nr:hypothetical protein [Gammaproteobacteria bacterium]
MKRVSRIHTLMPALLVSVFSSQAVLAIKDSTPSPPSATIEMITTYTSYAAIKFSPSYLNQLNCGGANQYDHVVIDWKDAPDKKAMLSAALAAYSLQKKVGFGMGGCHTWKGGTPKATRVEVSD